MIAECGYTQGDKRSTTNRQGMENLSFFFTVGE